MRRTHEQNETISQLEMLAHSLPPTSDVHLNFPPGLGGIHLFCCSTRQVFCCRRHAFSCTRKRVFCCSTRHVFQGNRKLTCLLLQQNTGLLLHQRTRLLLHQETCLLQQKQNICRGHFICCNRRRVFCYNTRHYINPTPTSGNSDKQNKQCVTPNVSII